MNAEYMAYLQSDEWKAKAAERLKIDKYRCQACGSRGTAKNPVEIHHMNYRSIGAEDPFLDLVTLCRCCHQMIHCVMNRVTSADGKRGWKDEPCIPEYHVYTLSGIDRGAYNGGSNEA